jgi:hypothetical protein
MSFSTGIRKSIDPTGVGWSGNDANTVPGLIVSMSFRLVIPWRVVLQQSPPPLRQPDIILRYSYLSGRVFFIER